MSRVSGVFFVLLSASAVVAADRPPVLPFESVGKPPDVKPTAGNPVDRLVAADLERLGLELNRPCSDEVFVRRVFLDAIGTLPEPAEVQAFLRDRRPDKRARLIDELLTRDAFADYASLKWCDLLRVKSEFPINLWPNAVQAYHQWVREAIRNDMPYDHFARALLTSSGSNFRVPPVNFYRAVQGRTPAALADAAALTLMGTRLQSWPADRRDAMAAFFSRVAYKKTLEWKEEIVYLDPAETEPFDAVLPDGSTVRVLPSQDPRQVFADWLIRPENPWFARNVVNRIWSWLTGCGIIDPSDDIRPDNPPANAELLACLERELVKSNYDLKAVYRLIFNSRTYQQSTIGVAKGTPTYARYNVRRLDAEVLLDAFTQIFGGGEGYTSPIPEPFSFVPEYRRTIALADGSITSPFLEMFGRPSRDTGMESERMNEINDAQRLHLLNSSHVQRKIEQSGPMRQWLREARGNRRAVVRRLYLAILSRSPTAAELDTADAYLESGGVNQGAKDLAWALVNSKEFLYRH